MMTATAFWNSAKKDENAFIFSVTIPSNSLSFQLPTYNGGVYNAKIDWGDNTTDNLTSWNDVVRTHTYLAAGTYDITITGVLEGWSVNNYADRLKIVDVKQWGIMKLGTGVGAFQGCSNLIITATDILDTSECVHFSNAFWGCTFSSIPNIHLWDVSGVKSMNSMFRSCPKFNQDISAWDVSSVTTMGSMFNGATLFNQEIGVWDTSSLVKIHSMFRDAKNFNKDLSTWYTDKFTTLFFTFSGATAFNQDIGGWNVSSVTNMDSTFYGAVNFNQNLGSWNTSKVTTMYNMFRDSLFNYNIGGWDVSKVQTMHGMFYGTPFNQDIGGWNVSSVTTMGSMFNSATAFNQDIGGWVTSSLINMLNTFNGASSFNQNLGGWDISKVTTMEYAFTGAALTTINYDLILIGWGGQSVQNNVQLNAGTTTKYTLGGAAEAARNVLINTYGWTIYDGGGI